MEGAHREVPSNLRSWTRAPAWNSEQALNKFQDEIGGPLKGGPGGQRLFEAGGKPGSDEKAYFDRPPDPPQPRGADAGRWRVVGLHHVFGSEPLSARGEAIGQCVPAPYIGLNPADAGELGLEADDTVGVAVDGREIELTIRIIESLPEGVAGIPVGLPEMPAEAWLELPRWTEFRSSV